MTYIIRIKKFEASFDTNLLEEEVNWLNNVCSEENLEFISSSKLEYGPPLGFAYKYYFKKKEN